MRRSQIFLAELLRGIEKLQIRDAQVARTVLRMLSLDRLEAEPEALRHAAAMGSGSARGPETAPPLAIETPPTPAPPSPSGGVREARLERRATGSATAPSPRWLAATQALRPPAGPTPASRLFQPLFPQGQARGLLTATLATLDRDGPLDVARAVEQLAQLRPLREFPRERVTTLRLGAQVLIDAGLGLAPFRPDVDDLLARIGRVLIPEQARVRHFVGTPGRGCVADGHDEIRRWSAPARATPILVVTDLGIGAPAGSRDRAAVAEWLEFFDAAHIAGGPVTALVPYGPKRWPRRLAGAVRIVHWDRRTTAAAVRRTLAAEPRAGR